MNSRASLEEAPGLIRALGTLGLLVFSIGFTPALRAQNLLRPNVLLNNTQVSGVGATAVSLDRPIGVAYDAAGNLYIADTDNFVIREVNLAGITTVVAGTGEQGFGGDRGPATSALLDSPEGIAFDAAGNLYIADSGNHRIREVTAGVISTIAGTGTCGFSGDGGPAVAAALCMPTAVAVDSAGGVYIADTNNYRIRKITGSAISTVAGNGVQAFSGDGGQATTAGIDSPFGVAVDSAFNIYIADTYNQRVRMVAYGTGIIATIAGTGVKNFTSDGAAAAAALALPTGIAVDSSATVYVADSDNYRIRSIASGQIATIAGTGDEGFAGDTGSPTSAKLDTPQGVAVFLNSLTLADTNNQAVRLVTGNGIDTTAGTTSNSTETLAITGATSTAYGTGTLTATFTNGNRAATGSIAFYDGLGGLPVLVSSTVLTANQATLNTGTLRAGVHYLTASYGGDPNDGPLVSGVYLLNVAPAAITAVANGVNLSYGQNVPALTGSLSGVLVQDADEVTAVYTTAAGNGSAPGSYPISISLSGASAGDYTLSLGAGSGTVTISKAATQILLAPSAATVAYGDPVTLTASVASTTSGTATGSVLFYDGPTQLNSTGATLSGSLATLTINTLPVGVESLTAVYSGDADFAATTSTAQSVTVLSPSLSANVTGLNFGSQPTGTTSAAQTVVLGNSYGLPITVTGIEASGDYTAAGNCSAIAAHTTCSVNVTFTPGNSGVRSGSLTVAIAQSGSLLTVPLTGIGTAPGIQVTPTVVSFGSQAVFSASAGQNITILNTGTANLLLSNVATTGDFSTIGSCATIPAGSNCNLTVVFSPTATGARTGTVTFTDNAGNSNQSQLVNLTGLGTVAGAQMTPSSLVFPSTVVGSTGFVLNTTLTNTGTAALTGISMTTLGDFSQTNTCPATLVPAASCIVVLTYAPTVAGVETGSLIVADNLGAQSVSLAGTSLAPGASLSTAQLVFGGQLVNTSSAAQTILFTNTGIAAVTVASVAPTANFSDTTNCIGSIGPGASCSVNVFFAPTVTGSRSGTVTIADSAGTQIVTAQGLGEIPGLAVTPSFAIFGAQVVGTTSQAQTLTAKNTGTTSLALNPIVVSSNFTESDQCSSALAPGASCSISLSFSPTSTGALSGSMVISDTTGAVSTLVTLSGQGALPGIDASPSTLSFGSLSVGTTSQAQTVTVSNTGSAPLQIGAVSGAGDFAETDNCAAQTIAPGSYCVLNVTMTPSTTGTRTGTIQIDDNADGAHLIALSGMGQQAGVDISPTSLAFGSSPIVSSAQASSTAGTSLSVTITNTGNGPLSLSALSTQGDFSESNSCGSTIAAGAVCTLTVTFVPTALGHRTGTLTITDNAAGGTQSVSLAGDGSPGGLTISPPVLNYGVQTVGIPSQPQTATLSNNTGEAIDNLVISASGEYSETNNCGSTLPNGASCTLQITVTPVTEGAITGTITVAGTLIALNSSAATNPAGIGNNAAPSGSALSLGVVAVSASAIPPGISLSIPDLTFTLSVVGSPGTGQTVTLTNTGSASSLTGLAISGTDIAEFPFTTTCTAILAAQASCTITIQFTPSQTGLRVGTLNIAANGGISAAIPESGNAVTDFTISSVNATSGGASQSISPGGTASYTIAIIPTMGTSFLTPTVLSVSGQPSGAVASIGTGPWTQLTSTSWQLPANTTLQNLTLSFNVPAQSASATRRFTPLRTIPPILWGILLLPFAARLRRTGKRLARVLSLPLLALAGVAAIATLSGCGSNNGFFGQPQQTYTITVTATTGTLTHSSQVTLTVQ